MTASDDIIRKAKRQFYLDQCQEDGVEPLSEAEVEAEMHRHKVWVNDHIKDPQFKPKF